jgi:GDPmannose 4,6-dehydratase
LVTGAAGQDGSWLSEHLLAQGFEVHGIVRAGDRRDNLAAVLDRLTLHTIDLGNSTDVDAFVSSLRFDRCFHLASQSTAHNADAAVTLASNTLTTVHLLDAVARCSPSTRFFLAGSAEQLAGGAASPQHEDSPEVPRSFYGLSKTMASSAVRFYRRQHGVFAAVGLLYNHESTRRDPAFLSRKMAQAVARIAAGVDDHVLCGDLGAVRDWGFAPEYVDAMARMLELEAPVDLVLSTGVRRTVQDLVDAAFAAAGLSASDHVRVDPSLVRAREPVELVGDPTRAAQVLGWRARKPFEEMIAEMVQAERAALATTAKTAAADRDR